LVDQYNHALWRGVSALLVLTAACSSGDGGPGGGDGGGIVHHTTVAGAQDTVHFNASVAVVVDNSTGFSPIDLDLSIPPDTGAVTSTAVLGSAMLRVSGLAEGRRAANVRQGSGGPVLTALFTAAHHLAVTFGRFSCSRLILKRRHHSGRSRTGPMLSTRRRARSGRSKRYRCNRAAGGRRTIW
jgi:hypothetical protein